MCQSITSKFYPSVEQENISLPDDFSLFGYSDENGQADENSIPLLYCISLFALNFLGNLHNKLMASDTTHHAKLAGVVIISTITTLGVTALALAESIIRFVPAIFGFLLFYTFLDVKKESKDEGCMDLVAFFFCLGETISLATAFSSIQSGYHMLTENKVYSALDNIIKWNAKITSSPES